MAGHVGGQLGGLLLWASPLLVDVRLQAAVEVVHAHAGVDNGDHDQNEGDDGEESQRWAGRQVLREGGLGVHAEQLEAEVGHSCEEEKLNPVRQESWESSGASLQ